MTQLVWFRNDLRVSDHSALTETCQGHDSEVKAIFLWTPEQWQQHDYGLARQYSIRSALVTLARDLAQLGIPLTILHAKTWMSGVDQLIGFARTHKVSQLAFHREFGWDEVQRDQYAINQTREAGMETWIGEDRVGFDPATLLTRQGEMYRVFTPFKKRWLSQHAETPLAAPLPVPSPTGPEVSELPDIPEVNWPGSAELPLNEHEAHDHLSEFSKTMPDYKTLRDLPATEGTSRLSAALASGAISLRQCMHSAFSHPNVDSAGVQTWLSELIWREFYHYLLYWRPEIARHKPFYPRWDAFPWQQDETALHRWQQGQTGVPIVDAGMRQLVQTGWMHNRVRMIVAMYLVKLLKIDWRQGERWFAQQLLDIDLASNNGGWQWCASTGVDAAPYFRIFNPYTQSERFDPQGSYIRRWVPELASVPAAAIHKPTQQLAQHLGYSQPLVDYKRARAETL
ncbi:MAG: FAD-binding domain-containing protein, partial [Saccharospirillum sp.]|uniref:deoxyribodipyrimidine photo-lyase n=1 Tax=Saccharospirillum sp. TaxID=2033801 RepID=UPI0034A0A2C6